VAWLDPSSAPVPALAGPGSSRLVLVPLVRLVPLVPYRSVLVSSISIWIQLDFDFDFDFDFDVRAAGARLQGLDVPPGLGDGTSRSGQSLCNAESKSN
jgi:hypothetical protein